MSRKINKVAFVLENCETVVLNSTDIIFMHFGEIKKTYAGARGRLTEEFSTDTVFFAIHKDAVPQGESFGTLPTIDRISKDVTYVSLSFEDGSSEYIQIDWNDVGNNYHSDLQHSFKTVDGHHVWLSETGSVLDEFAENVDSIAEYMTIAKIN